MKCAAGLLIAALWMAFGGAASVAATTANVPGFAAGPRITTAGLVWLGASGPMLGQSKISLAGATVFPPKGETQVPLTSSSSRWLVLHSRREIQAKKLGSSWHRLAPLSRCPPLPAGPQPSYATEQLGLTTVTGDQLFAVVDPRCLHRDGYGRAAIFSETLTSGSWRLLAPAPMHAVAIGASGDRIVIAAADLNEYERLERLAVTVYNARDGRLLYRVPANPSNRSGESSPRLLSLRASVDVSGDVLVTETVDRPPPVTRASFGWWATPARPYAHQLTEVLTSEAGLSDASRQGEPTPTADAALAADRIAYATYNGVEEIELLDVRTGGARTVARFPGEVGVLGLDASPGELAWAQQSSLQEGHAETRPNGSRIEECKLVVLGEPQLMSVSIDSIPAAGLTVGLPVPADTPPCGPRP